MSIQEIFEAYKEACMDHHYSDDEYQFDPASFDRELYEEVQ